MIVELRELETAKARLRVRRAEVALQRAEEQLDTDSGVVVTLALFNRICTAGQRVAVARSTLNRLSNRAGR